MKTIYALLEPDTRRIRYVGVTGDTVQRLRNHWSSRLPGRKGPMAEWMRTLSQKPELHVLQEVNDEVAYDAESYWIRLLDQVPTVDLINTSDMAHGYPKGHHTHSAEVRARMSDGIRRAYQLNQWNKSRVNHNSDILNRFSVDELTEIREATGTMRQIATRYGISLTSVHRIKSGKLSH